MPYIGKDGNIQEKRSNFRFSIITDFFWYMLDILKLFFSTLINPKAKITNNNGNNYVNSNRGSSSSSNSRDNQGGGGNTSSTARQRPNIKGMGTNLLHMLIHIY